MDAKKLEKYLKWCKDNELDPMEEKNLKEFTIKESVDAEEKKKIEESKSELKAEKMKKQKEIFDLMVKYTGIDTEYDDNEERDFFSAFDSLIKAVVTATYMAKTIEKVGNTIESLKEEE